MAHIHSVYDSDKHFTIDPLTRDLKNMTPGKAGIMQYDHNSERITFELPAVIEGHNTLDCNVVEVHYLNIDAQTKDQNRGLYEVDDLQASPDDSGIAVCSWLISRNATQLVGPLYFRLTFKCVTDVIDYSWSTAVYKALSVSDGINNSDWVAEEYSDILEQWRVDLFNGAGNGGGVTSWNDLTDKPFSDEKVYYEWNRNTEYAEKAPVYDGAEVAGYMIKLSNDTPVSDFFVGKYTKLVVDGQEGDPIQLTKDAFVIGEDMYTLGEIFIVVTKTMEITINEMRGTLTEGVWVPDLSDSPIESVKILDPETPVPEKFIPDTIARVSDVKSTISWNDIIDKPFRSGAVYEYDENNTYANEDWIVTPVGGFFENSGTENGGPSHYIRVSNDALPMDHLIGSHLSLTSRDGSRDSEVTITKDLVTEITEDVYRIDNYIVVVNADEYYNTATTFTKGVYFGGGSKYYYYPYTRVCISVPAILLPDDVIPDTIARISDVQAMIEAALNNM